MKNQEPKNVILIIVDSVRYYRTGVDDRDRLDFMDEFKNESVEFLNAFTSAPSSVMSAAAMFTGLHSAFVSRNYNDWEFDSSSITSLQSILKKNGYEIFSIDNSKVGREVKRDLILPLNKSWFPKGISHGQFWTNLDVTRILKNVLKKRNNKTKAFFMLWYDCRDDPNTSEAVQNAVDAFKEHGLFENSLVFLTSDHGYPDPRTGLNKNTMRNMRHDMVVTDDNIKIPLFVKGPGIAPGERSSMVSTIDFTPTILDFLGLDFSQGADKILAGSSLKPSLFDKSIDGNVKQINRLVRTDTRLLLQSGRVTAIRDAKNKLVVYQDEGKFELYDLATDPQEIHPVPVKPNSKKFGHLFDYFDKTQDSISKFHQSIVQKQARELTQKFLQRTQKPTLIFSDAGDLIDSQLIENSLAASKPKFVYLWDGSSTAWVCKSPGNGAFSKTQITVEELKSAHFGICFMISEKAHYVFLDNSSFKICKRLSNKVVTVDYNMRPFSRTFVKWVSPIWKYRRNLSFYLQEPSLFIKDASKIFRLFIKIFIFKDVVANPDMSLAKELRDRALIAKSENVDT